MRHSDLRGHDGGPRRYASAGIAVAVSVLLAATWPDGTPAGPYRSSDQSTLEATVHEAYELSGLVASPSYPGWYWAHSDVWEPTDAFTACGGLGGAERSRCVQVERARLWALRIDPVSHQVTEARTFAVANQEWALDPLIAQNNDWEDIAVGPERGDGTRATLVLAAVGSAADNRVRDAGGEDITCRTRRLIELEEPDLTDPAASTWAPHRIYDLKNIKAKGGLRTCDMESIVVGTGEDDDPTAFLVTRMQNKLLARSLVESTGRDPEAPRADADSDAPHKPDVEYLGNVHGALGLKITAADTNDTHVAMLVAATAKHPCEILTWPIPDGDLGRTLTRTSPTKSIVECDSEAEGLTFVRRPGSPTASTSDLVAVADANDSSQSTFPLWYFPHR